MNSIRSRLLLWLLASVLIASVSAAFMTYFKARTEANQLFDYHLKQIALTLQDQSLANLDVMGTLEEEEDYDFVIQVWNDAGVRRYFSHPHKALPPRTKLGYQTVKTDEGEWRVYTKAERDLLIQVAQPLDVRRQLARALGLRTMIPLVPLLLVLSGLIWFIVGHGLQPLERLAHAVRARHSAALQPIPDANLPSELKPLATSLNDLLVRLGLALQSQKDFVADAAHELRTPLTALQLQTQLAERAVSPEDRAKSFAQLKGGLKRATHLVQQLLTLARQEPGVAERSFSAVDLSALVKQVITDYAPIAAAKGVDLGLMRDVAVSRQGDREALRVMVGNIVDNAIRYTPYGGSVDVSISGANEHVEIVVTDTGLGIPGDDRERVFDRFYRREASQSTGSGLGLAIVKNIADRHGIAIRLTDNPSAGGLSISLRFPNSNPTDNS